MAKYIDKSALVAEIEKRQSIVLDPLNNNIHTKRLEETYKSILSFINTLEVKEINEHDDVDLDIICEEMGVEPDSRIASMFKNAFYKAVDKFLDKKENKL